MADDFEGRVEIDTDDASKSLDELRRAIESANKAGDELASGGLSKVEAESRRAAEGTRRTSKEYEGFVRKSSDLRVSVEQSAGALGKLTPAVSGLGSAIGGTVGQLASMTAAGGAAGLAMGAISIAAGFVIEKITEWTGAQETLNRALTDSEQYLTAQERAAINSANRIGSALTQLRSAASAQRQQLLLEDAFGSVEEQEAYVREVEGQLRLVEANVGEFQGRIRGRREDIGRAILDGTIERRQALQFELTEAQRAEAKSLSDSTAYLRAEIARRRALLEQAREETTAINDDLAVEAMAPTARRRGRGGGDQRRALQEALEASKRKQLELERQIAEAIEEQATQESEALKTIEQRRMLEQERLVDLQLEIALKAKLEQDAADARLAEEDARIAEKNHANEMFELAERRNEAERRRVSITAKAEQGLEAAYDLAQRVFELRQKENLSTREAFRIASKEFLKQFAMEQGRKALGAFAEGIGMVVTNPPGAATKFASGAAHAALAGAAGGIGAAIPGRGGGATRPPAGGGGGGGGQGGGTVVVNYNAPMGSREIGLWSQRNNRDAQRRFDR